MEIKIICSENLPDCPKCGEGKLLPRYSKDKDSHKMKSLPMPADYVGSGKNPIWDDRVNEVSGTYDWLSPYEITTKTENDLLEGKLHLLNDIQWAGPYGAAMSENGFKIFFKRGDSRPVALLLIDPVVNDKLAFVHSN